MSLRASSGWPPPAPATCRRPCRRRRPRRVSVRGTQRASSAPLGVSTASRARSPRASRSRFADQDVRGLDVAMQHAGRVGRREAVGDAREELDDLPPSACAALRPVLERAAVDELRDDVLAAVVLADVVHREDVRMIQRRGHLRFALEAPPSRRVEHLARQKLDAHVPIEPSVGRTVHDAHAAGTERALDAITTDRGPGHEIGADCLVVARPHRSSARSGLQRFDLAAKIGVSSRSLQQERCTLPRRDLERRTIQLVYLCATFRSHAPVTARATALVVIPPSRGIGQGAPYPERLARHRSARPCSELHAISGHSCVVGIVAPILFVTVVVTSMVMFAVIVIVTVAPGPVRVPVLEALPSSRHARRRSRCRIRASCPRAGDSNLDRR